jgi:hypothetical protein
MFASHQVKAFCTSLTPGTPLADVQAKADSANYRMVQLVDGSWRVEHPSSLGRAYCVVRFDGEERLSSSTPAD